MSAPSSSGKSCCRTTLRRQRARRTDAGVQALRPRRNPAATPSSALRSCRREDPSPAASAPAQSRRRAAPRKPRHGEEALAFWRLARKCFRRALPPRRTVFVPRAQRAGRTLRRANGRAEIHHRLRKIAVAARRRQLARKAGDFRLGRRQRHVERVQARDDAFDIAVYGLAVASNAIAAMAAAV